MPGTILLTTDLSEMARAAYPHAQRLARAYGLPIVLLHVVDRVYSFNAAEYGDSEAWLEQVTESRREAIEAEAELLRTDDIDVRPRAVLGRSIPDIVAHAQTARVVVMASHGYGGFRRFFLGSVASRVVQRSPAPALVVNGEDEARPYRRVLVGTDLSETATGVLQHGFELLRPLGAEVLLYHANVRPSRITLGRGERFELPEPEHSRQEYQAELTRRLEEMMASARSHGLSGTYVTEDAKRAADAIAERAETDDVDLIMVASHGRGRLSVAWLGSTCDELIRRTSRPVLVVRPRPEPVEG